VLIWDVLEYMAPALLAATIERVIAYPPRQLPAGVLHVEDRVPLSLSTPSASLTPATRQVAATLSANQYILHQPKPEKLFADFESVKFFLTRDRLREILIKR